MLIAVYGSLREGCYNHLFFLQGAEKKGVTTTPGRLYNFGAYPALTKDATSFSVECEIYEVDDLTYKSIDSMEKGAGYFEGHIQTKWGDAAIWYYPSLVRLARVPQVLPWGNSTVITWVGP
jgi:gamma-glutamylcyclotransferase (GGCT)/AIG2-like uncharacterized protein YtfP